MLGDYGNRSMRDITDVIFGERKGTCLLTGISVPSDNVMKKRSEQNTETQRTIDSRTARMECESDADTNRCD
jgi:hypothetical protein